MISKVFCYIIHIMYNQTEKNAIQNSQSLTISSIDSSKIIELMDEEQCSFTDTQSLQSDKSLNKLILDKKNIKSSSQITDKQQYSTPSKLDYQNQIQKPRFNDQTKIQDDLWGGNIQFIGFCQGGNKKPIQINQSKMKKAAKFFQDSPFTHNHQQKDSSDQQTQKQDSIFPLNLASEISQSKFNSNTNFSGGFLNAKTGSTITINQDASKKVQQMFKQIDGQVYSQKKPTKFRAPRLKNNDNKNLLKTVSYQDKRKCAVKPINVKYAQKRSKQKQIISEINNLKYKQKYSQMKYWQLESIQATKYDEFIYKWLQHDIFKHKFEHNVSECKIVCCYFCKKSHIDNSKILNISAQNIYQQIIKITQIKESVSEQLSQFFKNLYLIISFKLFRYTHLYAEYKIQNKTYNPHNILLQMLIKYKRIQSILDNVNSYSKIGPLFQSVQFSKSNNSGKPLNLLIVQVEHCKQSKYFFVLLTDGWSFGYAVISAQNMLYQILQNSEKHNKLKIGKKICISDWNIFFISNIMQFHPKPEKVIKDAIPIDITYNGSKIIADNSKLGYTKDIIFRKISKYKKGGGVIPMVQGIVLRMFSRKLVNRSQITSYLQLLSQSECYLMQFHLPEQVALSDLFSLYCCYQFRRIRIPLNKCQAQLQFYEKSNFQQINNKNRMMEVQQKLKSRLLNINHNVYQNHQFIDFIINRSQFKIQNVQFSIDEQIKGVTLLQQYSVKKINSNSYRLKKGQIGAQVSRIPKVYKSFQYSIL